MKYNDNGEWKEITVKTLDTLPTGAVIDYDGDIVPTGWEEVQDYSREEINTGEKWIDGKDTYRKVLMASNGGGTSYSINVSELSIDFLKTSQIIAVRQSDGVTFRNDGYDSKVSSYLEGNKNTLIISCSSTDTYLMYIILEYTKQ